MQMVCQLVSKANDMVHGRGLLTKSGVGVEKVTEIGG